MILGLIVYIANTQEVVVSNKPMDRDEAEMLKLIYEAQGHTVYMGSECKVFRTKKVNSTFPTDKVTTIIK